MTKLLEKAIEGIRELPDDMQDKAARQLIQYVEEVTDDGERGAILEGRRAYERGEFKPLDQWRHEMGIGDH
jgi:hypothetical protein